MGSVQLTMECAHTICNCTVDAALREEAYCGQACRDDDQNAIESEVCNCGHPPCDVP